MLRKTSVWITSVPPTLINKVWILTLVVTLVVFPNDWLGARLTEESGSRCYLLFIVINNPEVQTTRAKRTNESERIQNSLPHKVKDFSHHCGTNCTNSAKCTGTRTSHKKYANNSNKSCNSVLWGISVYPSLAWAELHQRINISWSSYWEALESRIQ